MLASLPLISLILLFLIFNDSQRDWRSSLLSSAIIWGILVTISTESLSILRLLTLSGILTVWLSIITVLTGIYYQLIKTKKRSFNLSSIDLSLIKRIPPVSLVLLAGITFIVTIVAVIALVAPPNTWDSMTYHMARVVHWIQNRSVIHYPTYFAGQLVYPPFAEYVIMHLQILSDGDRFANLVQWFSMVGSIIGVSLIAKQLGANPRGQIFAAVFCATLPMGILQGSSTQNDYVVTFWLVCLSHYILLALWSFTK